MWQVAYAFVMSGFTYGIYFFVKRKKIVSRYTLMDVGSVEDVVVLVRRVSGAAGTDELAERLERLFIAFPPDDGVLQRASMFQQECEKKGNDEEFCTALVHVVLMRYVVEYPMRPIPVMATILPYRPAPMYDDTRKTKSCPSLSGLQ